LTDLLEISSALVFTKKFKLIPEKIRKNHYERLENNLNEPIQKAIEESITKAELRVKRFVDIAEKDRVFPSLTSRTSSFTHLQDSFFDSYKGPRFSLIFIDGLHEAGQTYKDLVNSLNILEAGGIILIDDVWPSDEASSLPDYVASVKAKEELGIKHWNWFGDVYKVVGAIKLFHPDLELKLIGSAQEKMQAVVWRKYPAKDSALTVLPENLQQISEWTYADFFGSKPYRFEPSADSDPEIIVNATRSQRF
jgi:hypothetical protein